MFRLDRSLTLYAVEPLLRFAGGRLTSRLAVLMYHSICEDPELHRSPYFKTNTTAAAFANQMKYLADSGYQALDLESALAQFKVGTSQKIVAVTFDDGYRDFYTSAFPVLKQHGFSATMYLPTGYISARRQSFNGRECLNWEEVNELRRHGMAFGSHTVSHRNLPTLSASELSSELVNSRRTIEDALGEPNSSFAHPYAYPEYDAAYVARFKGALESAGYKTNVTTRIGRFASVHDSLLEIPRLPMNSLDDAALTRAKLRGAYDWLYAPQAGVKRCKGLFARSSNNSSLQ